MQQQILENPGRGLAKVKEAAAYLNVSVAKLYLIMDTNELHFVKIGKSRRIAWKALEEFIERCTVRQ
jgi:excisionase family DNA binding protein